MENRITSMTVENSLSDKLKMNKVCLVDADYIKHITSSRASKIIEKEFIEDLPTMKQVYRVEALGMCSDLLHKIRDPMIFCFSGKSYNTFRYKISIQKEYKGNRKNDNLTFEERKLKLELMNEAMEAIMAEHVTLIFDDLEADDIVSMLQDDDTYILSKDKDLKQIPGYHYNFETNKTVLITPEEAIRFLATQLLTGDSTDNIMGIKGCGPKTAEKILKDVTDKNLINAVFKEYKRVFGIIKGTDLFCQNWMLIKLRMNHGEYFMKKYESAFSLLENIKKNHLTLNP